MMKPIVKASVALGLGAVLMASVADPSFARNRWVGPAVGFAAGVAVGAAAANANGYYNDPYYYDPYGGPYAAGPAYAYPSPAPYYPYYQPRRSCSAENIGRPGC